MVITGLGDDVVVVDAVCVLSAASVELGGG